MRRESSNDFYLSSKCYILIPENSIAMIRYHNLFPFHALSNKLSHLIPSKRLHWKIVPQEQHTKNSFFICNPKSARFFPSAEKTETGDAAHERRERRESHHARIRTPLLRLEKDGLFCRAVGAVLVRARELDGEKDD